MYLDIVLYLLVFSGSVMVSEFVMLYHQGESDLAHACLAACLIQLFTQSINGWTA